MFSAPGEGEEGVRGTGKGGFDFFFKIPRGGFLRGGGAEGPGGCLQRIGEWGGGGLNFFFRGRNAHQETAICPPSRGKKSHTARVRRSGLTN